MTTPSQWLAGARPKTLPAAIAPVVVGTAFAGDDANLLKFLLALSISLGLQIGVNYANDYSDGVRGTDSDRVGPMRLVGSGIATPKSVKLAALISIAVASVAGVALAARSSWLLLLVGALSILAAWTYTGGPKPYGYLGLGEFSVFIFFGLVATTGTYFAQVNSINLEVTLAATAIGSLACAILILNNLRDRATDEIAGKMTLAVRIGDHKTRRLCQVMMLWPILVSLALAISKIEFMIALGSLPYIIKAIRELGISQGRALIPLLAKTGRIQMLYASLLSIAALVSTR